MSATQSDPVGTRHRPPIDPNEEEEERDDAINNLGLMDIQKEDTIDTVEYNPESESEKGQQPAQEKPKHVGFWAHELNNVRLHVIHLWVRTGKAIHMEFDRNELLTIAMISSDPVCLHLGSPLTLQWRFLSYPPKLHLSDRLCRRL